jgi:uncharacterized membrane protein YjjP (DUF1212 family)
MKTRSEIIKQAAKEIEAEDNSSKIEQVKNILRQIAAIKISLAELEKQLIEI